MIRGIWDRETVALLIVAAILPVVVAWMLAGGSAEVLRLLTAILVVAIWQLLWMLARAQAPSLHGLVTAAAVAILAPPDLGPLQFTFALSFGVVFGELAFGGWGRNVLNPATVTLAFAGFGFPAAGWPDLPVELGWAAVPAGAVGAALGVFSPGLLAAATGVFLIAAWVAPEVWALSTAAAVVLVLLAADPVASAETRPARWANGALYGALLTLFALAWSDAHPVQAAVSAALLASLAAPLLDDATLAAWRARRKTHHG